MNYNDLTSFVLILVVVGLMVGVGVLALDKFGDATKESTVITNESFTVPAANATVTLSNGNITTFTQILNASGSTWTSTQYSIDLTTGVLNNTGNTGACTNGTTCYAYYTYDEYDTTSATAIDAGRDAVGAVSNTWLTLIVTIGILAIILGLIIGGFGGRRK